MIRIIINQKNVKMEKRRNKRIIKNIVIDGMKVCSKCMRNLPVNKFCKRSQNNSGLCTRCKDCEKEYRDNHKEEIKAYNAANREEQNLKKKIYFKTITENGLSKARERNLKHLYNLNATKFIEMVTKQQNCCAICNKEFKDYSSIAVDHDHFTGKVRGLLCRRCNTGLGQFNDNLCIVENAYKYLRRNVFSALSSK
jgi:hypothetical protein